MASTQSTCSSHSFPKKTKVTLTGTQETLLGTVSAKAADALNQSPILGDRWAAELLTKVDYDFNRLGVNGWLQAWPVIRSRGLDRWTREFLDQHLHAPSGATVLHLACGLDSRALRLQRYFDRMKLRWVDVDLPDVISLRKELMPDPDVGSRGQSNYELLPVSVTEPDWFRDIPADRPTLIVFEGLSMYLAEEDARDMIRGLVGHFAQGQLIFDAVNSFFVASQRWISPVAKSGSTLKWYVDRPLSIESWAEGLSLRDEVLLTGRSEIQELPWKIRLQFGIAASLPRAYQFSRELRYSF
ncbi:O-methyltransferase [Colletotrichum somersetense]|nr:O-methyltransferase [Colletotrichum somersetense]